MMLDGALDEIAAEFVDHLKVATVKLDRSPNLGLWYGIRCIPTMLYFVDGEVSIGIFGTTSKEAILSQLKPVMSSRRMPEPYLINMTDTTSLNPIRRENTKPIQ